MIANIDSLRAAVAGTRFTYLLFWGHEPAPDGSITPSCLSQWWPCRFEIDGETFVSAEHFMMAGKARLFGDEETRHQILLATHPSEAKKLGRLASGFDRDVWEAHGSDIVVAGNVAKFGQDPLLHEYLLNTGDLVLVEASPVDLIWGTGVAAKDEGADDPLRWRGRNLLGFALMRARALLRAPS